LHACRSTLEDPLGCGITADTRSGELLRVRVREVPEVNEIWICDAGRFGHEWADQGRLKSPLVRGTELEFVIMVIAVSCVKLLSAHNSTQHTSRKHKV
jgi:NADH dehydrogenase subunit G (EC 1.6.5.3)